ncbi:unnamed protein product [Clonostachys solani]|uniref:Uncharacterized protein n=1 Tax=Clonostachys solani TaxID=160281 RepID=A0A9N9ZCQ5_9HYPO|nr:unnamed protein product [Clonostachys solani]
MYNWIFNDPMTVQCAASNHAVKSRVLYAESIPFVEEVAHNKTDGESAQGDDALRTSSNGDRNWAAWAADVAAAGVEVEAGVAAGVAGKAAEVEAAAAAGVEAEVEAEVEVEAAGKAAEVEVEVEVGVGVEAEVEVEAAGKAVEVEVEVAAAGKAGVEAEVEAEVEAGVEVEDKEQELVPDQVQAPKRAWAAEAGGKMAKAASEPAGVQEREREPELEAEGKELEDGLLDDGLGLDLHLSLGDARLSLNLDLGLHLDQRLRLLLLDDLIILLLDDLIVLLLDDLIVLLLDDRVLLLPDDLLLLLLLNELLDDLLLLELLDYLNLLRPLLLLLLDDFNVHVLVVTVTVGAVARPLGLAVLASGLGPLAFALMAGLPVTVITLAVMFMLVGALDVILDLELVNLNVGVLVVLVPVVVPVLVLEVVLVVALLVVLMAKAIMLEDVLFTMLGVNDSAGRGQAIEDGQGSQDAIGTHCERAVYQTEL